MKSAFAKKAPFPRTRRESLRVRLCSSGDRSVCQNIFTDTRSRWMVSPGRIGVSTNRLASPYPIQAGCESHSFVPEITLQAATSKRHVNHQHQSGGISLSFCITAALAMIFLPHTCAGQKIPYAGFLGGIS